MHCLNTIRSKELAQPEVFGQEPGAGLVTALRGMALSDEEFQMFEHIRDHSPPRIVSFE